MITTTLNRIREHAPCENGWERLLAGLGKTKADDEPLPFATILKINGLNDALWCCRVEPQYAKEWRLLAVAYARRVQNLNTNPAVKNATDVAERYANGGSTERELDAARAAASAATRAATRADAWSAAEAAAWATAESAASAASMGAAWAASMGAAWAEAPNAERKWQTEEFLRVVTESEARGT